MTTLPLGRLGEEGVERDHALHPHPGRGHGGGNEVDGLVPNAPVADLHRLDDVHHPRGIVAVGLADVPDAVSKVAHGRDGQLLSSVADDTALGAGVRNRGRQVVDAAQALALVRAVHHAITSSLRDAPLGHDGPFLLQLEQRRAGTIERPARPARRCGHLGPHARGDPAGVAPRRSRGAATARWVKKRAAGCDHNEDGIGWPRERGADEPWGSARWLGVRDAPSAASRSDRRTKCLRCTNTQRICALRTKC